MALKKRTLRKMSPTARKVARLAGEAQSVGRRLINLVPLLQSLDLDRKALQVARSAGLALSDTDARGLVSAIVHGQQTGYFDNPEWAYEMLKRLNNYRDTLALFTEGTKGKS